MKEIRQNQENQENSVVKTYYRYVFYARPELEYVRCKSGGSALAVDRKSREGSCLSLSVGGFLVTELTPTCFSFICRSGYEDDPSWNQETFQNIQGAEEADRIMSAEPIADEELDRLKKEFGWLRRSSAPALTAMYRSKAGWKNGPEQSSRLLRTVNSAGFYYELYRISIAQALQMAWPV